MKHNIKTFPHRNAGCEKDFLKSKDAAEWVDANIRCPEYHKWLKEFEKELRDQKKLFETQLKDADLVQQSRIRRIVLIEFLKEILGDS